MARLTERIENHNIYLGCHPVNHALLQDEDPDQRSEIPFKRFDAASILNGLITGQRELSRRRVMLDRAVERMACSELPGQDHVVHYLQHMYRRNRKATTIKNTHLCLRLFLKFIKKSGAEYIEQVTRRDLEAYVEYEQDQGMKSSTVRYKLHCVYAFFRFLESENVIHPELLYRKIRIKLPQSLPKAIAPQDIVKLLSVIDDARDRAMILTLLRTGMRIGELLSLRINDVDLAERTIKIYEGEKNSIGRVVYLSDDASRALRAWLKKRNQRKSYLFYGPHGRLSYTGARERFVKYIDRAGLTGKGYTLHCLRHTYATDLLNAGMRLECLQQLLGHSNIEVTRIYARLTDATREEEYFKAMAKIERGETDEHYQLDHQL